MENCSHLNMMCLFEFSRAVALHKFKQLKTAAKVLNDHWFNVYGVPQGIHSDKGKIPKVSASIMCHFGIKSLEDLYILPKAMDKVTDSIELL